MRGLRRSSAAVILAGLLAGPVAGQSDPPPIEVGGLLRTGLRVEPESSPRSDGFDVFDARLKFRGKIGIVFDYFVQTELTTDADVSVRLLDARASLPIQPELRISFGLFRTPFSLEGRTAKGDLKFLERSQAVNAIAPLRQVGVQVSGEAVDARLTYSAGVFNGNGRRLENDGDDFLFMGHVAYNTIGPTPFFEDLVIQVGASLAYSEDTAARLGGGLDSDPGSPLSLESGFDGDRLLWGLDAQVAYRGWSLTGEYLRGDYDLAADHAVAPGLGVEAHGGYVQAAYKGLGGGALEGLVRYDGMSPATGESRDFILIGLNVFPGYYAKFGLQYAIGLHDSPPSPVLADGQLLFVAQVDF